MKKIIMLLLILSVAFVSTAQPTTNYYTAYKTQILRKYKYNQEWTKISDRPNQDISIAITGSTLQINAQLATTFIMDQESVRTLDTEELYVLTYDAREITTGDNCTIDFVVLRKSGETILGVNYMELETKVALHYFIRKNN